MKRVRFLMIFLLWAFLGLGFIPALHAEEPPDIIARVGDQVITLQQIDTMINSSSIVGLDIPALGTPERNQTRVTLLDKVITANLLYLDALKNGADKNDAYRRDVNLFAETIIAALFREKVLVGDLPVTDQEVRDYYDKHIGRENEFTEDVRLSIEATLRKQKLQGRTSGMRDKIRENVKVSVKEKALDPAKDGKRKESVPVAKVDKEEINWGEVKELLTHPSSGASGKERRETLERYIDERVLALKARKAGLEKDPVYLARVNEFKKTRLVNLYRSELLEGFGGDDKEVEEYYKKNRERIVEPEARKVQMVVLKTRKEAQAVLKKIESGKITLYEAAREYSIDPNAKTNLGEIGWVSEGTGFPELDRVTFSLPKDQTGGPVESPAGWHLVKVLEIRDPLYNDVRDASTMKKTRRMLLHEKLDQYVVNLRKNAFPVEVYEDVLGRLMGEESEKIRVKRRSVGDENPGQGN